MQLADLLTASAALHASDLHISSGMPPMIRIDGDLQRLDFPSIQAEQAVQLLSPLLTEARCEQLAQRREVDCSWEIPGLGRYRISLFQQYNGLSAAIRLIPDRVYSLTELNLPPVLRELTELSHGLVLVTGPTGSGKSTTLAALLDCINATQRKHLITLEDPIEFLHTSQHCLVQQREMNHHTAHVEAALRAALREDPDVILLGEMRDLATIRLALTAAETGHLVLATLHAASAAKAIHRMVDVFPGGEKALIRSLLAESLQAIVCQTLVKKIGGGRVAAFEILRCIPAIRHLIREDKIAQIYSAIQTGAGVGMQTLEYHLHQLRTQNVIA